MKRMVALCLTLMSISACTSTAPKVKLIRPANPANAVSSLQLINTKAYECWAKDKAFKGYAIIPELDTTGTPRILLVAKGKAQGLPKLVITAAGRSVQTFGPLAQSPLAPRINADVSRWAAGASSCTA